MNKKNSLKSLKPKLDLMVQRFRELCERELDKKNKFRDMPVNKEVN